MQEQKSFINYFVNFKNKQDITDFVIEDKGNKRSSDNAKDSRIKIHGIKVYRKLILTRMNNILSKGDLKFEHLIADFHLIQDVKAYHYAVLLKSGRVIIKHWLKFLTEVVFEKVNARRKSQLCLITIMALKEVLTIQQINKLLQIVMDNLTPATAVLINYYFPKYLKEKDNNLINSLIFEVNEVEKVILDFENTVGDFFRDLNFLIMEGK